MFLSGVLSGANVQQNDPEEERDPPSDATPVSFPSAGTPECRTWNDETPPPNFQAVFGKIAKPADISEAHLRALNIELQLQCSVEEMLPLAPDGSSYIPSLTVGTATSGDASYADAAKADPALARKRKDFEDRAMELSVDNATGYRAIMRNNKPGVTPPRLAYMRMFWQGLESMSQYWDCTLDQYYAVSENEDRREKSPKRQKLDDFEEDVNDSVAGFQGSETLPVRPILGSAGPEVASGNKTGDAGSLTAEITPHSGPPASDTPSTPQSVGDKPLARSSIRYKGFRTNSGRYMPDQFRTDTVRGFVEGTVWPFQCSVHPPRLMPLVHFNKLKLPVRQSVAVYRLPTDRARARAGGIVGPVLGVQVRAETEFDDGGELKARLDIIREIGALLQLAQERARQGKKEVRPGTGKWWTTVPRWGGGPGGEVENQDGNSDVVELATEMLGRGNDSKGGGSLPPKRQKKTPAMLWKELRPGAGYFDPKTDYVAIGKDPASDYDDVFLLSALNHHVSILKLTVHRAYVEYTVSATPPNPLPHDPHWCRPVLQRSKWWDLFDVDERTEAFRSLWGVTGYLTREVGEVAKGEEKSAGAGG